MIFINASPKDSLKIFQPFTPLFIPLGTSFLSAILERNGRTEMMIDQQVEKNPLKLIRDNIQRFEKPYLFGFNVLTATYKSAVELARQLKEIYPESKVIFGGMHSTALPDEVLSHEFVDVVVKGEAELIIDDLWVALKHHLPLHHIPGLAFRQDGEIYHTIHSSNRTAMDDLPPIPYHKFKLKYYDLGYLMTSRGCPHNCIFCSNSLSEEKKYRFSSIEKIMEELTVLYVDHKVRHVLFLDDSLLVNKERAYQLAAAIRSHPYARKMIFTFQARGDHSDPRLLREMYASGFRAVYFGLETASETLMQTIKKGEHLEDLVKAIRDAKQTGLQVGANFIFGLPGEKPSDRKLAFKLARDLKLDIVKYNNAAPYPGTELFQMAKDQQRLNIRGMYENINATSVIIENPLRKTPIAYVPPGNTEGELRFDILHGTFLFYFNWRKVKRFFTYSDLNYSWFDFGKNFLMFLKKAPSILLFVILLTIKLLDFLVRYPYYQWFHFRKTA